MTWYYEDTPFTSDDIADNIGFVYLITNLINNKMYIGKKGFQKSKTFQKNNKRRRKKVESDWQTYYGSCFELQNDVKELGVDNFKRQILRLCKSKSEMNYFELAEQIHKEVLLTDMYYNSYIGTRIHRKHLIDVRQRLLHNS